MFEPGQIQARLRQLPDQALQQMLQGSAEVPGFYVMAEMTRRQRMRGDAAGDNRAWQSVRETMQPPAQPATETFKFAQGGSPGRKLRPGDPGYDPAMDEDLYGRPASAPQGDIYNIIPGLRPTENRRILPTVATPDGSGRGGRAVVNPLDNPSPSWSIGDWFKQPAGTPEDTSPVGPPIPEHITKKAADDLAMGQKIAMQQQFGDMFPTMSSPHVKLTAPELQGPEVFTFKDRTAQRQAEIAKDREALALQKKRDFNSVLMNAGVAMMGGRSPYFMSNLAEGAKAGLGVYTDTNKDRRTREEDLQKQERGLDSEAEQRRYLNVQETNKVRANADENARSKANVGNQESMFNATQDGQTNRFNVQQQAAKARLMYQMATKGPAVPMGLKAAAEALARTYGDETGKLAAGSAGEDKDAIAEQQKYLLESYTKNLSLLLQKYGLGAVTNPADESYLTDTVIE